MKPQGQQNHFNSPGQQQHQQQQRNVSGGSNSGYGGGSNNGRNDFGRNQNNNNNNFGGGNGLLGAQGWNNGQGARSPALSNVSSGRFGGDDGNNNNNNGMNPLGFGAGLNGGLSPGEYGQHGQHAFRDVQRDA
jgi:hypothetical protein